MLFYSIFLISFITGILPDLHLCLPMDISSIVHDLLSIYHSIQYSIHVTLITIRTLACPYHLGGIGHCEHTIIQ